MLEPVLEHIKDQILSLNPKTFQAGYSGARQYQDGRILIYTNDEGKYVGLKDNENNYFYIRNNGEIDIDFATDRRSTSCTELTGNAPLRLVAWVKNANLTKLLEVLLHDIMGTDFGTMDEADREVFSDLILTYDSVILDPEQIYKEETLEDNNDEIRQTKGVTLVAIDFGIRFNYKLKENGCIDRDVCVGCTV